MTIDQWGDWVVAHQELFSMRDSDDLMKLWREVLIGYEYADLRAASIWINANEPAPYRSKQLHLLQDRVRSIVGKRRADENALARSQAEIAEAVSKCIACPGNGIVVAPDLEHVIDGEWIPHGRAFRVTSIFCACRRGQNRMVDYNRSLNERQKQGRAIDLIEYEHRNPDWREQLQRRDAVLANEKEQAYLAGHLDKTRPLERMIGAAVKGATR